MLRALFGMLAAIVSGAAACHAQKATAKFDRSCTEVGTTFKSYLRGRDLTIADGEHTLRSPKRLLDAEGKTLGTERIRQQLASPKPPFFIWSTPLHAAAFVDLTQTESICVLGLTLTFHSMHGMVVGIIPVPGALILRSNGKLEGEYMEAIKLLLSAPRCIIQASGVYPLVIHCKYIC